MAVLCLFSFPCFFCKFKFSLTGFLGEALRFFGLLALNPSFLLSDSQCFLRFFIGSPFSLEASLLELPFGFFSLGFLPRGFFFSLDTGTLSFLSLSFLLCCPCFGLLAL